MQIRFNYAFVLCRSFQSAERDSLRTCFIWPMEATYINNRCNVKLKINHFRSDKSQQIPTILTITRPTTVYYKVVLFFLALFERKKIAPLTNVNYVVCSQKLKLTPYHKDNVLRNLLGSSLSKMDVGYHENGKELGYNLPSDYFFDKSTILSLCLSLSLSLSPSL